MKAQISHGFLCAAQAAQAAKGGSMTVYLVNILYLVLFLVLYWKDRRRMANGFLFFILLVLSGASLLRLAQDTQSEFLYFVVFAVGILVALTLLAGVFILIAISLASALVLLRRERWVPANFLSLSVGLGLVLWMVLNALAMQAPDSVLPVADIDDLPVAVVNSVDPICLHCKLVDAECLLPTELEQRSIPSFITAAFNESLILTDTARRWFATIGQFSIIRLERDTQLLIPAYDYCLPDKECPGTITEDDPCTLFSRIRFPVEEFFPPDSVCDCDDYRSMK